MFGLSTLLDEASNQIQKYTHAYYLPKILFLYLMSVKNGSLWVYKNIVSKCLKAPNPIEKEMKDNESQETLLLDEDQEMKHELELHKKTEVFVRTVMEDVVK